MAKPVGFEGANTIYRAPKSMSPEECGDLEVFKADDQIISCWRVSEDELAEINRTGVIWLAVIGQSTPPVKVSGFHLHTCGGEIPAAQPFIQPAKRKA